MANPIDKADEFQQRLVALVMEYDQQVGAEDVVNSLLSSICDLAVLDDQPLVHVVHLLSLHYTAAQQAYAKRKMQ